MTQDLIDIVYLTMKEDAGDWHTILSGLVAEMQTAIKNPKYNKSWFKVLDEMQQCYEAMGASGIPKETIAVYKNLVDYIYVGGK